ncbi:MAG: YCF48-related protein [Bacteroidia bacterium]
MKKLKLLVTISFLFLAFHTHAQNWYPVTSGTTRNLNTIHFPSPSVGYIGGDDSLLLKTTDGGLTWNPLNLSGIPNFGFNADILNIQFLTDSIGYMTVGPYSNSYKTVDGGLNWTVSFFWGINCYNQGLFFFDQNNGFIGGAGCFQGELISKLTNGVWSAATMNSSTWSSNLIVDIDFYNTQLGLAASSSGLIYRTTDGGFTWDSIPSHPNMNPITSVLMINDTLAYASYKALNTGFGLYITTDGGLSWAEDFNSATFFYPDFLALHQSGNGEIFSGGYSPGSQTGLIFRSPGDIVTWNYDALAQKINDISSYNDSIVFAVGDSGAIYVNKILIAQSVFENPSPSLTIDVFPNPAQQFIQLSLPEGFETKGALVSIYAISGQLITRSTYSSVVDISTFSTGKYFLEIRNQKIMATGKFIVD